ncbi:MAG: tetratricopeptide repeat protein [Candidatus Omnitrophota bacterium]
MEELKKHKRHNEDAVKEADTSSDLDAGTLVEEADDAADAAEKPVRRHPRVTKKARAEKVPDIGHHFKVATNVTLSTAERIINGLSNAYQSVFVAPEQTQASFNKDQGYKYFEKGDFEKSQHAFLLFDEENPGDVDVLYMLAMCHKNMEEHKEAVEYLKKAEKLDKNDVNIITELGDCLVVLEEYAEAIPYLLKAIEVNDEHADSYYHLGTCYEKTENVEEAKKFYKKAIDVEPRQAVYYQALGFLYESNGNHNDAIVCFKKAMDLERGQKRAGH